MDNLLTFIIPCYNAEKTIIRTLNSLLAQTYKRFCAICIDDGSTDNTKTEIRNWKNLHPYFELSLISKKNTGVSDSRNIGIKATTTKYLAFCDADDVLNPTMVEKLLVCCEDNNLDTAFCKCIRCNAKKITKIDKDNLPSIEAEFITKRKALDYLMYKMGEVSICCYIFRTDIVRKNNILFDIKTARFEDREFNWKYLCHCESIMFCNQYLYDYILNDNSAVGKLNYLNTDGFEACKRIEEYVEKYVPDYYEKLKTYLFHRLIWSKAKSCAVHHRKDLFLELINKYDVKQSMKIMKHNRSFYVSFSSRLFLINPNLFYCIIGVFKR